MYPTLYRRRLIPDECIRLKDDTILYMDDKILVTSWKTLKPRKDFHHGYSCYFFEDGIKVSQFLKEDGSLLYWYCDIVTFERNEEENTLTVIDLLADVTVDALDVMNVLDIDELCEAKEKEMITENQFFISVKQLGSLIATIQKGEFGKYTDVLLAHIN